MDTTSPRRKWRHRSTRLSLDTERVILKQHGNRATAARAAAQRFPEYSYFSYYRALCGEPSNDRVIDFLTSLSLSENDDK